MTAELKETVDVLKTLVSELNLARQGSDAVIKTIMEDFNRQSAALLEQQKGHKDEILGKLTDIMERVDRNNSELLEKVLHNLELNQAMNRADHNKRIALWGAIWLFLQLHHDAVIAIAMAFAFGLMPYDGLEKLVMAWITGIGATLWLVVKNRAAMGDGAAK